MNIVFMQHLKMFFRDHLHLDKLFVEAMGKCDSGESLADYLADNGDTLARALDVELCDDTECEECNERGMELEEIRDKVVVWDTMDEERKFEAYMELHSKYNAQQMHDLLS